MNQESIRIRIAKAFTVFAGIVSVACFFAKILPVELKGIILALWIIIPPIWFKVEHKYFYEPSDSAAFEKFKYSQQLMKDIWFSIATALAIFYFKA